MVQDEDSLKAHGGRREESGKVTEKGAEPMVPWESLEARALQARGYGAG